MPNSAPAAPRVAVADLTERALIARIQARLPPPPDWLLVGIGDDAAVVSPERNRLEVLTVDSLVEGIHFDRAFTPADAIGHRALAVNLSDVAAMGASPRLAVLSLALPPTLPLADFDAIIDGFARLAARHRVHLVGGNLTRSPGPLVVDVTAVGTVKPRRALLRRGARPGDELYVTGTIGAAAAGLMMLKEKSATSAVEPCVQRYLYPEPRVRTGVIVGRAGAAAACMDLSDGLADAVRQVAEASGVGAAIDAGAIPIDPAARSWFATRGLDPIETAIAGGDDYELLFTVRPRMRGRLRAVERHSPVPITRIGTCTDDGRLELALADGRVEPVPAGFSHFR